MSNVYIKKSKLYDLWWKSAGRCEFKGCNKPLYKHGVTLDECNIAEFAHIIASSENGPRGHPKLSEDLANDIKNIMLLCSGCHKYIDNEGKYKYTAEMLYDMKQHHEDRIARLTSLGEDLQTHVVTYGSKIGTHNPEFLFAQIQDALLPDFYPVNDIPIYLGGNWSTVKDWDKNWEREIENLEYNCRYKILDNIDRWEYKRIALFALAPMPLLVKLGTILNNKHEVEIFQKQRSGGWKWSLEDVHTDYIINRPENTQSDPVLALSLSFPIADRVKNQNPKASIWEMTIESPNPDFLRSKQQLYKFGREIELLLDEITKTSNNKPLKLYLSVPIACAIEFGRVWMQKANSSLKIYDLDKQVDNNDKLAITIENKK